MPLKLEIVTPEARVFPAKDAEGRLESGSVDSVVLPGVDGELGVLPSHAPWSQPFNAESSVSRKVLRSLNWPWEKVLSK